MKKKATIWALVLILTLSRLYASGVNERLIGTVDDGILPEYRTEEPDTSPDITEILYSVGNVYSYLDSTFLYEMDGREIEESLIAGLVAGLGDRYSYYISEKELEEHNEQVIGEYVGIGTYVSKMNPGLADPTDPETYMLQIVSPFPGGPADRAGLLPGDLIGYIDGEDLSPLNAFEASRKLRGELGKEMTLSVFRGRVSFDLKITPENVIEPSTAFTMLDDGIGYLEISRFKDHTDEDAAEAIGKLLEDGMTGLIIDLRFNGGGLVDTCLNILDLILPEGSPTMSVKYSEKSGRRGESYFTAGGMLVPEEMPIAVLINDGSASASEIMTGALRDNGRALLVGTKTFGKGIIQQQIPYKGGAINITYAKYLTPSGEEIHEKGIEPDIEVLLPEYTEEETLAYFDIVESDAHREWVAEHPELTEENVQAFCDEYAGSGAPENLLWSLVYKEYAYRMPLSERPIVDLKKDIQLQRAMEELRK